MPALLEIWTDAGRDLIALGAERVTVGKDAGNAIAVPADKTLSHLHAAFEPYGAGWCVRDLGSRNGTYVNGERILSERALRHGDEVRAGAVRITFRADRPVADATRTQAAEAPPDLTRREREVLVALCRPVLSGAMFSRPATIREIAAELFVTENAVKQHLSRLYDKFAVHGGGEPRPVGLANEAIRRGAVSIADLRAAPGRDGAE